MPHRAIPSILTGKNPGFDKLPIAASQPDNLFTLLNLILPGRYPSREVFRDLFLKRGTAGLLELNNELQAILNYRNSLVELDRLQQTTLQNLNVTLVGTATGAVR